MGKLGVLNADYVRSDMRRGELRDSEGWLSTGYDFGAENDAVQAGYRTVHQARVGLELRLGDEKQFRLRSGGGMSTSPFVGDAVVSEANRAHVSVGGGYRIGNVHFSAAWRTAWHSEDYYFMGAFSPEAPGQLQRRASSPCRQDFGCKLLSPARATKSPLNRRAFLCSCSARSLTS